jgi:hypothetical protein
MSTYEDTAWCCTTGRGSQLCIVDEKHDELKSNGRFWYQEIRDFLKSKHTVFTSPPLPGTLLFLLRKLLILLLLRAPTPPRPSQGREYNNTKNAGVVEIAVCWLRCICKIYP